MAVETPFRIVFLALLAALLVMRLFFMLRVRSAGGRLLPDRQAVQREGGRGVLAVRVVVFVALVLCLGSYIAGMAWIDALAFPLPAGWRWAGAALGLVSLAFWIWTQATLDTQWSAQLQLTAGHQLVTTGPYAWVRHPLYMAMGGWGSGLALLTANWIFVGLMGLIIAGLAWRVPKEEQMMIEGFGETYRTYMRRTGRFFPIRRQ